MHNLPPGPHHLRTVVRCPADRLPADCDEVPTLVCGFVRWYELLPADAVVEAPIAITPTREAVATPRQSLENVVGDIWVLLFSNEQQVVVVVRKIVHCFEQVD